MRSDMATCPADEGVATGDADGNEVACAAFWAY